MSVEIAVECDPLLLAVGLEARRVDIEDDDLSVVSKATNPVELQKLAHLFDGVLIDGVVEQRQSRLRAQMSAVGKLSTGGFEDRIDATMCGIVLVVVAQHQSEDALSELLGAAVLDEIRVALVGHERSNGVTQPESVVELGQKQSAAIRGDVRRIEVDLDR